MMQIQGKAIKLGNDISTDQIIAGKYTKTLDMAALASHVLEDLNPHLAERLKGTIIVAGENFGQGSSREQAPLALKYSGVQCVLAKSLPRIFFRNAINIGLPAFVCNTDCLCDGDTLVVDMACQAVYREPDGSRLDLESFPPVMLQILTAGGLVEFFRQGHNFAEFTPAEERDPDEKDNPT